MLKVTTYNTKIQYTPTNVIKIQSLMLLFSGRTDCKGSYLVRIIITENQIRIFLIIKVRYFVRYWISKHSQFLWPNFDFLWHKISVTNKCNWPRKVDLKLRIVRFYSVRIVRYPFHSLILAVLSWINFVTWRQTFKIKCKQCQNWNYILVYSKKNLSHKF